MFDVGHVCACCLQRAADAVEEWVRTKDWVRLAAEKRAVLGCMAQVLAACISQLQLLIAQLQFPVQSISVRVMQSAMRYVS